MLESVLARGEAFRRWLSDLGREDLLPEASAHGRLGYRRSLTLPGLPFPVQMIRPAGEREASEQQANPGMDASTLVGAFSLPTVLSYESQAQGWACLAR